MMRLIAAAALVLVLGGCRTYDQYSKVSSQKGLVPADQWAKLGREQAQAVAIGRELARANQGSSPEARAKQAAAAVAYAKTLPDVHDVAADTLAPFLTVSFKSGWRVGVNPIADGKSGPETPGVPAGAGATAGK
jgi:hypothetical protein